MTNHLPTILAVVPGSRYLGFAILSGRELKDWGIRVIKRRSLEEKLDLGRQILSSLSDQHKAGILVMKSQHPSRSSSNLDQLTGAMADLARFKSLKLHRYPLERVKASICGSEKANKAKLAARVCEAYPFLSRDLEKEQASRNPYRTRMFEAVALGLTCLRDLGAL